MSRITQAREGGEAEGTGQPRVVALVQARIASTRLPGKVLAEIAGKAMLARVVERVQRAPRLDQVFVATSTDPADDPIEVLCRQLGYPCFRGSGLDVLDRMYQAARQAKAEVVVRLTADCPLIDPEVIEEAIRAYLQAEPPLDFLANRLPGGRHSPVGLDVEICSFAALERAWREADQPHQREHVMPFLYEQPERFRTALIWEHPDYSHHRWTVDTPEDLAFVRRVYEHFGDRDTFGWREVLALVEQEPELASLNASVAHRNERDVDPRWPERPG